MFSDAVADKEEDQMSLFTPNRLYIRFKRGGAVLLLAALLSFNVGAAWRTNDVRWYPDLYVLIDDTLYQIEDYSGLVIGYAPSNNTAYYTWTQMYSCPKFVYLNGINYTLNIEKGFGLIGTGDSYDRIIYEPPTIYGDHVEVYRDNGDGTVDIRCYGNPNKYPSGVDVGPWLLWYTSSNPTTELSGVGLFIAAEKSSADEIAEILHTDPNTSGMANKLTQIGQISGDLDEIGTGVVFDPSEEADLIQDHIDDIELSAYRIGTGLQAFFTNPNIAVCVAAAALTLVFLALLRKAGD